MKINLNNSLLSELLSFKVIHLSGDWILPKGAPHLLANSYHFKKITVQGIEFILAEATSEEVEVKKVLAHQNLIKKFTDAPILFSFHELKIQQQKALIEKKVNYSDRAGNLFFPDALIVVKNVKDKELRLPVQITTWCKVAIIRQIVRGDIHMLTISELAEKFAISKMHASRFVEELKALNLIHIIKEGTSKRVQFLPDRELWQKAERLLGSPLVKKVYLNSKVPKSRIAGYTALGSLTMIDSGDMLTQAVGKRNFLRLEAQLKPVPREFAKVCLEVWEWAPEVIIEGSSVDPLSLYMSMKDDDDDRTQIALKEILNNIIGNF
ncbi:MAG: hypothetical protein AAGB31_00605 [Bdellovibrio sp.]